MDRRLLIASGLAAAGSSVLARAAGAQSMQPSELPPVDPAYGYGPPPSSPSQPMPQTETGDDPGMTPPPPRDRDAYGPRSDQAPPDGDDAMSGASPAPPDPRLRAQPSYPARTEAQTYSRNEVVNSISDFMGVPAEAVASLVERLFRDNGSPTAYVAGEEGSGAVGVGLRYGKGLLYMKGAPPVQVYWRGPSIGWDVGGNASRVFTLCYNLHYPDVIFRRFPGVEGSAYFIGGLGVTYQRAEDVTLAPVRAGVGLRLGANVGYIAYSKKRHIIPF